VAFSTLTSDQYQNEAQILGFVPLKGEILNKARSAGDRIGKQEDKNGNKRINFLET
tara:strand:- start:247 stop:414 length:168 start_codon:yes stop_codon:yes gene_type:complete